MALPLVAACAVAAEPTVDVKRRMGLTENVIAVERTVGGVLLRASCAEEYATQLAWLFDVLEREGFRPGEGAWIRLGWSKLKLFASRGTLVLHEPDFDRAPLLDWRSDLSTGIQTAKDIVTQVETTLTFTEAGRGSLVGGARTTGITTETKNIFLRGR